MHRYTAASMEHPAQCWCCTVCHAYMVKRLGAACHMCAHRHDAGAERGKAAVCACGGMARREEHRAVGRLKVLEPLNQEEDMEQQLRAYAKRVCVYAHAWHASISERIAACMGRRR